MAQRTALPEPSGHKDAVFGLAEEEGRVLLLRNPRFVGGTRRSTWDLPGGTVEPGERLQDALVREWREETGLSCRPGPLRLVVDGVKRRAEGAPPIRTWRAFLFSVETAGDPAPGAGIDEVRWVLRDDALVCLEAPYHAALRAHLRGDERLYAHVEWIDPIPEGVLEASLPGVLLLGRVAATAAVGEAAALLAAVDRALDAGEAPVRVAEALLQVVPYAGFPRAIAAFRVAASKLADVPRGVPAGPRPSGREVFEQVYGETAARVREGLERLDPALARWTEAFAYGEVLARPGLTLLEREILAVQILTAMGHLDDPLLGHLRAALRLGATPPLLADAIRLATGANVPAGRTSRALALLARA